MPPDDSESIAWRATMEARVNVLTEKVDAFADIPMTVAVMKAEQWSVMAALSVTSGIIGAILGALAIKWLTGS